MTAPEWWTAADEAELQVLVAELVDGVAEHRERCAICSRGGSWCEPLRRAFAVLEEWRWRRALCSRAVALRARQDLAEAKAAA
jgi:hypothetical protein